MIGTGLSHKLVLSIKVKASTIAGIPLCPTMSKLQMSILAVLLSLLLASLAQSASLPENHVRVRRSSADQRIAELQALMALSPNSNGDSGRGSNQLGHGLLNIDTIGKKKRADNFSQMADEERYRLLMRL